jgi:hypothetical protein
MTIALLALTFVAPGLLRADVVLTEFMSLNQTTLVDDFGNHEDWIEIHNPGPTNVNLANWALTDTSGDLDKWLFPVTNLPPGGYVTVFASDRNRRTPGAVLHTNFKLSGDGEYLALVRPDGSIATQFSPEYPTQSPDVAYGLSHQTVIQTPVTLGTVGRATVPLNGASGTAWTSNAFNDLPWIVATNGIGFETGLREFSTNITGEVMAGSPVGFWRLNETTTNQPALNIGSLGVAANGQFLGAVTNNQAGPHPPAFAGFDVTNNASRFNGSNARVDIPYSAALNPSGPFTIECWVNPATLVSTQSPVAAMFASGSGRRGFALYRNGSVQWEFRLGNDSGIIAQAGGGMPQSNVWTHLVGVYDGVNARLFVNGLEVAAPLLSGAYAPNTNAPLRMGAFSSTPPQDYFNGLVDKVALYDTALAAEDIARHFDNAATGATNYASLIRTSLRTAMHGVNSSAYLRIPFVLNTGVNLDQATLRVNYDDGFTAFLNGTPMASANAPASPAWNSTATNRHPTQAALAAESFDVTSVVASLVPGSTNVLALQGLNLAATNNDFLLLPELEIITSGYQPVPRYFVQPTPGAVNGTGSADLGPILSKVAHFPTVPTTNDHLTITCRVTQTFFPISAVTLRSRVMFGTLKSQTMLDDGLNGDGVAGDGIYGALIHRTNYAAGQMVRWYINAVDSLSRTSRWPLFDDPLDSAEYLGTVVQTNYVSSKLPVVHLFAPASVLQPGPSTSQIGADSNTGGRVAVFYDGEFYDNVFMFLRGNTTANYNKKSHRLRFNREHKFRHNESNLRVRNTSFVADYPDPTYLRQRLSYWFCTETGAGAPFYAPYRLQLNGQFYQLANHNDVHGDELLERLGYDPNGALYNAVGTVVNPLDSAGGFDKKTRQWENNNDYAALAAGIAETNSIERRQTNLFDLFDLPQVISYMVAARIALETDDVEANMSLYHDNDGDDLWRIIPFDMNLSWGASYYEDVLYSGIQATNDHLTSFPLYGSTNTIPQIGVSRWNRMYDAIFTVPQTREMFRRRLRTMLDAYVKPPGTPAASLPLETRITNWFSLVADEAVRDRSWWGWPAKGGQSNFDPGISPTNGRNQLLTNFLAARRQHLYGKHSVTNTALTVGINRTQNAGIPLAQPTNAVINIIGFDFNPASGNQDEEFILLTNANSYAVDISGWKLSGGISHTFQPGTVIPTNTALYLTPSSRAFRNRALDPRGGMGLFVQGGYDGRLNAWGESLTLRDDAGRLVSSNSFIGAPSLAQQFLRITEIMYNPSPAPAINADAQQFEYIELRNISGSQTLNLNGVRFTNGIQFNFTGSAITNLAPGARVLLVRNPASFTARYGAASIAGQFIGGLDSSGESLRLEDSSGEKILEFAYNNSWYRITDGLGFSLVIVDDQAHWSTWDKKSSWRPSGLLNGSPGLADPAPPVFAPMLVNEILSHTDPPLVDSIELHNPTPTNVHIGGWFITDDFYAPKKFRIPNGTQIPAGGFVTFYADDSFGLGGSSFQFSEYGEGAWLFGGDAQTNLTGYAQGYDFGAAPNGVAFGRHMDSEANDHFVLQSTISLDATNAAPLVGPVVIAQIMYHPPDFAGPVDNDLDEFIELRNLTASPVPLFCTFTNEAGYSLAARTNTWYLRNAVDFDFPTNITLTATGRVFVVGFNPTNTLQLAAFRSLYNLPTNVPVFGPWSGKLDNSQETIELKRPDRPDLDSGSVFVPYVLVDKVAYEHTAPWPTSADNTGLSLQRRALPDYGNDPINWRAAFPPGTIAPDTDNDGMPDWWETANGLIAGVDDSGEDPDNDGLSNRKEYLAGTGPFNPGSTLALSVTQLGDGQMALSFAAVADQSYTLQSSATLSPSDWQSWQQIQPEALDRVVTITVPITSPASSYFRLVTPATP